MQGRACVKGLSLCFLFFAAACVLGQQAPQQPRRRQITVPPSVAARSRARPSQPVSGARAPIAPRPGAGPVAGPAIPPGPISVPAVTAPPPPPPPKPAFRVNQREVSEEEVMRFAWTRMGKLAIRDLADEILIRQAAAARGIKLAPGEVDARLKELAELAGGEQALVAKRGVAGVSALRQQIETELLLAKLVEAQGRVTDAEAREYYQAHRGSFTEPTRLHLFEIVTDEAEAAYQARSRVASGEAFTAVAREVSRAPSAAQGGDLGWLTLDDIGNPVLRSVAATLKTGEVSTPVLVEDSYYIYFLAEVKPGTTKSFEEVRDEVIDAVRLQRGATPEGVLNALRRKATIVVLAEPFKYVEAEYAELKHIKITVDGERVNLRPAPLVLPTGRMIVPAKPFLAALGCHVQWRPATKTMVITRGKKSVQVSVGSNAALADGRPVTLDQVPETREGITWIAPRQIAELLGFRVNWDATNYTLLVTSPAR